MNQRDTDRPVRERIQELVDEEHRLYEETPMSDEERRLRETGQDPSEAHVRPPEVVENYEQ
jgi:hypothetical protein